LTFAGVATCDPRTLARPARDFAARQPAFVVEAGLLALYWIVEGHGYKIIGRDVLDAHTMRAAEVDGASEKTRERIEQLASHNAPDGIVRRILATHHG
jgi:hypothetical protein